MEPSRASNRFDGVGRALIALSLALALGCGGATLETATELPKTPRRPDGVVLEPPPALPAPHDRAPARGVIGLREPVADRDIEDIVATYFRAFVREDLDALSALLASGATYIGSSQTRGGLVDVWRARMRNFEYQRLLGTEVYKASDIERHTYDTLGVPGAPARPEQMVPGDVLVRVPVGTPNVAGEQLFGDVVVLLLRRDEGHLRIAGAADESGH